MSLLRHGLQKSGLNAPPLVYLVGIITAILIGFVLSLGKSVLVPLLIALFMAYLIMPIANAFHRFQLPGFLSALLVLAFFFLIFSLFGYAIYQNIQEFALASTAYGDRFDKMIAAIDLTLLNHFNIVYNPIDLLKEILSRVNIPALISSGVGTFFSFFSSLVLVFFYLSFILAEKRVLKAKLEKIGGRRNEMLKIITRINEQIQKYIALKTIISVATGLATYLALKILGVDFAELWAMMTFLLNFIPNIGSIVATIPPIIIALLQQQSFSSALVVAVTLLVIQVTIGNIVEPRVFGHELNLSPLLVFFSLIFWGSIWGVTGMILSVPIMASISIITWNIPSLRKLSILMREKG